MLTRAAVARRAGHPLVIEKIELPELGPTEILVRVVAVGVCHTDIASLEGRLPAPFPAVFGHEGAGVVERAGAWVSKVRPGDHVVLAPDSDGTCEQCASGEPTYCERFLELNFQAGTDGRTAGLADGTRASIKYFGQSSFSHYAVVGERAVVKVRRDLPLRMLGPLGCSIQTGVGTVVNGLRPPPGSSIAILGTGPVGMSAILGAVVCGCSTIVAIDRVENRLDVARGLGATHTIDTTRSPDVAQTIRAVVDRGVSFIVDTAGAATLTRMALGGLARRGTLALVASAPDPNHTIEVPWTGLLIQGQAVRGFVEGNSIPDIFIPRLCDLYAQGRLPFDRFVRFYPFEEINRAILDQKSGQAIKPILELPEV